ASAEPRPSLAPRTRGRPRSFHAVDSGIKRPLGSSLREQDPLASVGYQLADVVQEQVFNPALADQPRAKPAEVALLIARRILHAPAAPQLVDEPVDLALSWLHEL